MYETFSFPLFLIYLDNLINIFFFFVAATVMNFKEGIVNKITCFDYVKKSASVKQIFYAHRVIPSLLVQEIKITNPTVCL